jgi:hypothetical protein
MHFKMFRSKEILLVYKNRRIALAKIETNIHIQFQLFNNQTKKCCYSIQDQC